MSRLAGQPRPRRGRRPAAELASIRTRVELLMLQGLRSPAIHRALTGPESPNPVTSSERQVRAHMAAVEQSWLGRSSAGTIERERAKAIAIIEDTMRVALQRSTIHAGSNVGVGYFNAHVKLQERWARLCGLDAPARRELSGPDGAALGVGLVALAERTAGRSMSRYRRPTLPGRSASRPPPARTPEPAGGATRGHSSSLWEPRQPTAGVRRGHRPSLHASSPA